MLYYLPDSSLTFVVLEKHPDTNSHLPSNCDAAACTLPTAELTLPPMNASLSLLLSAVALITIFVNRA